MPDTRDLCTVADVNALMQKSGVNASAQDSLIQALVTRASVKIMRDYAREFTPGGPNSETFTNAVRTFEYTWEDHVGVETYVDLSPYDLQTSPAPTVIVNTDTTSPATLSTDEYRLWPVPASQGVYEAIRLSLLGSRGGWPRWTHRQFTVQGNWGFPSVPFEVAQACAETVIHWITTYPAARRAEVVDSASPVAIPRSYPMKAVDLLGSFKRVTV